MHTYLNIVKIQKGDWFSLNIFLRKIYLLLELLVSVARMFSECGELLASVAKELVSVANC